MILGRTSCMRETNGGDVPMCRCLRWSDRSFDEGCELTTKRVFAIAAATALVIASSAAGSSEGGGCHPNPSGANERTCIIDVQTSAGDRATVAVAGNAVSPRGVYLVVYTSKPQRIDLRWSFTCSRGYGRG